MAESYFVHHAKTARVRAGLRIRQIEQIAEVSRSTISRLENGAGVSEISAFRYLNALKELLVSKGFEDEAKSLDVFDAPPGARNANVVEFRSAGGDDDGPRKPRR